MRDVVREAAGVLLLSLGAMGLALLFLAVCAWGGGGWNWLFSQALRAEAAGSLLLLAGLTPICGCHLSIGRRAKHGNDWVLWALLVGGLSLGYVSGRADRTGHWVLPGSVIPGSEIRYVGLALFVTGCILRIIAIRTLGGRFTVWVAIQPGHELVTDRIYRHLRHPSYTGAILTLVGWAMSFRSLSGLLIALAMGVLLISRMDAEEELLLEAFPEEYAQYRRRSWRLVPLIY